MNFGPVDGPPAGPSGPHPPMDPAIGAGAGGGGADASGGNYDNETGEGEGEGENAEAQEVEFRDAGDVSYTSYRPSKVHVSVFFATACVRAWGWGGAFSCFACRNYWTIDHACSGGRSFLFSSERFPMADRCFQTLNTAAEIVLPNLSTSILACSG